MCSRQRLCRELLLEELRRKGNQPPLTSSLLPALLSLSKGLTLSTLTSTQSSPTNVSASTDTPKGCSESRREMRPPLLASPLLACTVRGQGQARNGRQGRGTCVLGADKGHLVGIGLEADEATLPVHGSACVRVEGVEPRGQQER